MKNVSFDRLVDVVAMLRSDNGCPWDLAQTHESLKADLIEEAYELIEAIDAKVPKKICDELGDLLMQVMLHSQIATDRNEFSVDEVIENLTEKLVRRHPHVFGSVVATDENEVLENWEEIKRGEEGNKDRKSSLDGIPHSLPSLQRAEKIQKRASRAGFDWDQTEDVLPKLQEEIDEIEESIRNDDITEIEMEIGDLLFSVVNLCRFLNVQPEEALRKSTRKFVDRFQRMETALERTNKKFKDYDLSTLDQIWEQVKQQEKA
ncbi:nucleoside triphosphate pyrophosphohydrolase [Candidatus Poribacteria bacterium]|jgi:tetrapyrrole methylase family protein/MazG family protein|nr:nucleoside triphosphate pyrophosphohydrolase [Candidatus Poribacteria bacterium]|tara:strand:- start:862 stop:1647 length:786 start_codon:yes stop_codon:yes gene_type:complete